MRLQSKLLLMLIPLVCAALVAIGSAAFFQLRGNIERTQVSRMNTLLDQLALQVQAKVRSAEANATLFASGYLLEKYALVEDEAERYRLLHRPLLRAFAGYQNAYPDYYELRFILPDGYEAARRIVDHDDTAQPFDAAHPLLRKLAASGDEAASMFGLNPDNGELSLYAGRAVRLRDSGVDPIVAKPLLRGFLVITVRLGHLHQQVAQPLLGDEGKLFVTDDAGRLLLGDAAPATVLAQADRHLLSRAAAGNVTGRLQWLGTEAYLGGRELGQGLILYGALPTSVIESATAPLRITIVFTTILTIVLFSAVLFAGLRRLVLQPLRRLQAVVDQIGRGQLGQIAPESGSSEMAGLTQAFARMARHLAESHEQARFLADHDSLTGLPNRRLFQEYLDKALAFAKRRGDTLVLLFLDVDEFKNVNDTLGHHAGDELLQEFSERLLTALRSQDVVGVSRGAPGEMVARLGGDEFTILLPVVREPADAATVAERILEQLREPFVINRQQFFVGASIGITLFPHDGDTVADLVKHADLAMYHAKHSGKNNYQFFAPDMNAAALRRMQIERKLHQAIGQDAFELHLQPILDLADGRVVGAEALVRWRDAETGRLVPPGDFIPVAETSGLILPIGDWVLSEACRVARRWRDGPMSELRISVNVSALQVESGQLSERVRDTLHQSGLEPCRLELELTETVIMASAKTVQDELQQLREMGVSVALDDFGVGYSSLNYLRHFSLDKLKIDRSFVRGCIGREDQRSIVRAIIAMAHALGHRVVAEGIEDDKERRFLLNEGCDLGQGFLFSRPLPLEQFERFVLENAVDRPATTALQRSAH
ncbi:MAG: EAL domain-containing protein [Gammaproteobacteria bacterium]|nr:EAL domain-containing protein [Gammaproteobacteria bacterium]